MTTITNKSNLIPENSCKFFLNKENLENIDGDYAKLYIDNDKFLFLKVFEIQESEKNTITINSDIDIEIPKTINKVQFESSSLFTAASNVVIELTSSKKINDLPKIIMPNMVLKNGIIKSTDGNIINSATKIKIIKKSKNENDIKIGGLKSQFLYLKKIIEMKFNEKNPLSPSGVLLIGPPGTGKTMLARKISNEIDANFIYVKISDIVSKFYGDSENNISKIFEQARKNSPTIIFFDEFDAITKKRDDDHISSSVNIQSTLLTEMDGINNEENNKIFIVAATNLPNSIDNAFRRPGRLEIEIEIPIPNESARKDILEIYLKKINVKLLPSEISEIISITAGFSGADIKSLVSKAYFIAYSEKKKCKLEHFLRSAKEISPSLLRESKIEPPKVSFEDIGGLDEVKDLLNKYIFLPMQHKELFKQMFPSNKKDGIIMYGPPGTGKTSIAKAVANFMNCNFIQINPSQLLSKFFGESEKKIHEIFKKARQVSPSILFIDEIDFFGSRSLENNLYTKVLSSLLQEIDGLQNNDDVILLAATNKIDFVDEALLRAGRFGKKIEVPLPNEETRKKIFEIHLRNRKIDPNINLSDLAKKSKGLSGADIKAVCDDASYSAINRAISENIKVATIKPQDFKFGKLINHYYKSNNNNYI